MTLSGDPLPITFHWASAIAAATADTVIISMVKKSWSRFFFSEASAPTRGKALAISAEKCVTDVVSRPKRTALMTMRAVQIILYARGVTIMPQR